MNFLNFWILSSYSDEVGLYGPVPLKSITFDIIKQQLPELTDMQIHELIDREEISATPAGYSMQYRLDRMKIPFVLFGE